ncbi:hypothetical protein PR002_g8483 [Phytophthora rubi]|uniref:Uncharacterized protein n=1 Tax=Phytophthora rubi TaxID=129364 RepID=A0A6A3MQE3_9STRA|nr:hypothetical protein PR002_g8483 [Phytophthora rubi]
MTTLTNKPYISDLDEVSVMELDYSAANVRHPELSPVPKDDWEPSRFYFLALSAVQDFPRWLCTAPYRAGGYNIWNTGAGGWFDSDARPKSDPGDAAW